jgi:hypothetical protein
MVASQLFSRPGASDDGSPAAAGFTTPEQVGAGKPIEKFFFVMSIVLPMGAL